MKNFESMNNKELAEFVDYFLSYAQTFDRKALLDLRAMSTSLKLNAPVERDVFDRLSVRTLYWEMDFNFALFDECIRRTQTQKVSLGPNHFEVLELVADGKIRFGIAHLDKNYASRTPRVRDLYNERLIEVDKPTRIYHLTKTGELEHCGQFAGAVA